MAGFRLFFVGALVLLGAACAQVPQSSVRLSHSITDDVVAMQAAHKTFINYYYDSLEVQANNLIDNKYRPSLIRQVIEQDVDKFKMPDKKYQSLFNAIQMSFIDNTNMSQSDLEQAQANAMAGMKVFYTKIDNMVESERKKLLDPLKSQRQKLMADVDANYSNIVKKNAAITALLSTVVDVQETQQQLYVMAGAKGDLREQAGDELSKLTGKIDEIQKRVDGKTSRVEDVEAAINHFKAVIEK